MTDTHDVRAPAIIPEDLGHFFVERANAGDVEGLVQLYTADAVLAFPADQISRGSDEIRRAYRDLLADRTVFQPGEQLPALRNGDLALTSTRLAGGGATAEVARRQPDGTGCSIGRVSSAKALLTVLRNVGPGFSQPLELEIRRTEDRKCSKNRLCRVALAASFCRNGAPGRSRPER